MMNLSNTNMNTRASTGTQVLENESARKNLFAESHDLASMLMEVDDFPIKYGKYSKATRKSAGEKKTLPLPAGVTELVAAPQKLKTWMLRNIPCRFHQEELIDMLDKVGFEGRYNFFYLPIDVKKTAFRPKKNNANNRGYAFINLKDEADSDLLFTIINEKKWWEPFINWTSNSKKSCIVCPATQQGFLDNMIYYKAKIVGEVSEKKQSSSCTEGNTTNANSSVAETAPSSPCSSNMEVNVATATNNMNDSEDEMAPIAEVNASLANNATFGPLDSMCVFESAAWGNDNTSFMGVYGTGKMQPSSAMQRSNAGPGLNSASFVFDTCGFSGACHIPQFNNNSMFNTVSMNGFSSVSSGNNFVSNNFVFPSQQNSVSTIGSANSGGSTATSIANIADVSFTSIANIAPCTQLQQLSNQVANLIASSSMANTGNVTPASNYITPSASIGNGLNNLANGNALDNGIVPILAPLANTNMMAPTNNPASYLPAVNSLATGQSAALPQGASVTGETNHFLNLGNLPTSNAAVQGVSSQFFSGVSSPVNNNGQFLPQGNVNNLAAVVAPKPAPVQQGAEEKADLDKKKLGELLAQVAHKPFIWHPKKHFASAKDFVLWATGDRDIVSIAEHCC